MEKARGQFRRIFHTPAGKIIGKIIFVIFCSVFLLGAAAFAHYMEPIAAPKHIKHEFQERGYSVDDIEFTYVGSIEGDWHENTKLIFHSSEPIPYEGNWVDEWEYYKVSMGTTRLLNYTYLEPHTSGVPVEETIDVTVNLTASEYDLLLEAANGENVEEYIISLIRNAKKSSE